MRGLIITGLVSAVTCGLFISTPAMAAKQPAKKAAVAKKKAAPAKTISATTAAQPAAPATEAPVAVPAPATTEAAAATTSVPAVAAPGAVSTATMTETVEAAKPRKIKGEIYAETKPAAAALNYRTEESKYNTTHYVGVKYALTDTSSVSVRQLFTGQFETNKDNKWAIEDTIINYANSKVATFAGDGTIINAASRVYLPTGESSRFVTERKGRLMTWWIASKPIGGDFSVNGHLSGNWYLQSQNGYDSKNPDGTVSKINPNVDYDMSYALELEWAPSKYFSLTQSAGVDNTWFRPIGKWTGKSNDLRAHAASFDTTLGITPFSGMAIYAGVSNSPNIYNPKEEFAFFREDEVTYVFILSASI